MKIDVCGIPFSVSRGKPAFKSGPQFFGECLCKPATIVIHEECSPEQFDATLIHEWAHGVLGNNGCDDNEQMVAVLTMELYRVGFRVKVIDEEEKSK